MNHAKQLNRRKITTRKDAMGDEYMQLVLTPAVQQAQTNTSGNDKSRRMQPMDRPGNAEIQLDLFLSYGTNVPLYHEFQAFFRKYQPPTLIVWGKNDFNFPPDGAGP